MGAAAAEYAYKEKGWRSVYVVTDSFIDYTTSSVNTLLLHSKTLAARSSSKTHIHKVIKTSQRSLLASRL